MNNFKDFFKNKKITVMGLGLLGRGVGDALFLAECGAKLTITDLKPSTALRPSLRKLRKYKNIKYVLGKHKLEDFRNADMILKSAGVPLDSPYIKEAWKNKIPIEMSATLFAKNSGIPMLGVTGSRGKSTVTHLIAHILKSTGKKVVLGGNVRGISNLQLLKEVKAADMSVFELDSWQLQGFGEAGISPHVAVFATFYQDHLGYYDKDLKKYFSDKGNIFKYQKSTDTLIAGKQPFQFIKKWGGDTKGKVIIAPDKLPKGWKFNLPGSHNEYNASIAVEAARVYHVPDTKIKKALATFTGVPGRLELIRELKGVKYYNDTTATTPEATLAALQALGHPMSKFKNIILIAGGSDKGLNMDSIVKEINKNCKKVILLSGTGTNRIKSKIKNNIEAKSMKEAVAKAKAQATQGDVVLLSPAFASFGMFDNEFDRGDQFTKIVKSLK